MIIKYSVSLLINDLHEFHKGSLLIIKKNIKKYKNYSSEILLDGKLLLVLINCVNCFIDWLRGFLFMDVNLEI